MPRYYFDVTDGESDFKDRNGIDMDQTDVPNEACNLLRLLAYAKVPHDKPSMLVAEVRTETGKIVYHASAERLRRTS